MNKKIKVIKKEGNKYENKIFDTNMKFIDLCCGIGGFHQALNNMGMECVMASDIDEECRKNYEINYNIKPEGDLTKINIEKIPDFDVLCAGFPCQPFSKAGHQSGFEDDRGNIFFDICKIIKHRQPKYVIMENVKNLISHDKGNTWKVIKSKIEELGYNTYEKPLILNALYFGVPQSRERVLVLCKRKDLGELEKIPEINKKNIKKTKLSDIIENNDDEKYKINGKMKITRDIWNEFLGILNKNNISIPKFPIWTDCWDDEDISNEFYDRYKNWIDKNREFYKENKKILENWLETSRKNELWKGSVRKMEWQCGCDNLDMSQVLWSPRGSGVRIKKIDYSPTLVAMASMIPIYGPKNRQLTPRECARLQSFSDSYKIHTNDKIAYKQFGNAVNVKMIEKSAQFLINNKPLFE
jgi:DNA (cytosine-5)-methyltransferase 1